MGPKVNGKPLLLYYYAFVLMISHPYFQPHYNKSREDVQLDEFPFHAVYPTSGILRPTVGRHSDTPAGLHHVDVILVHGLTGSSAETWSGPIKLRQNKTLWPEEYFFSEDPRTSIYGLKATEGRPFCKSVRVLIVEHGLFLDNADPLWTMENAVKMLLEDFKAD